MLEKRKNLTKNILSCCQGSRCWLVRVRERVPLQFRIDRSPTFLTTLLLLSSFLNASFKFHYTLAQLQLLTTLRPCIFLLNVTPGRRGTHGFSR